MRIKAVVLKFKKTGCYHTNRYAGSGEVGGEVDGAGGAAEGFVEEDPVDEEEMRALEQEFRDLMGELMEGEVGLSMEEAGLLDAEGVFDGLSRGASGWPVRAVGWPAPGQLVREEGFEGDALGGLRLNKDDAPHTTAPPVSAGSQTERIFQRELPTGVEEGAHSPLAEDDFVPGPADQYPAELKGLYSDFPAIEKRRRDIERAKLKKEHLLKKVGELKTEKKNRVLGMELTGTKFPMTWSWRDRKDVLLSYDMQGRIEGAGGPGAANRASRFTDLAKKVERAAETLKSVAVPSRRRVLREDQQKKVKFLVRNLERTEAGTERTRGAKGKGKSAHGALHPHHHVLHPHRALHSHHHAHPHHHGAHPDPHGAHPHHHAHLHPHHHAHLHPHHDPHLPPPDAPTSPQPIFHPPSDLSPDALADDKTGGPAGFEGLVRKLYGHRQGDPSFHSHGQPPERFKDGTSSSKFQCDFRHLPEHPEVAVARHVVKEYVREFLLQRIDLEPDTAKPGSGEAVSDGAVGYRAGVVGTRHVVDRWVENLTERILDSDGKKRKQQQKERARAEAEAAEDRARQKYIAETEAETAAREAEVAREKAERDAQMPELTKKATAGSSSSSVPSEAGEAASSVAAAAPKASGSSSSGSSSSSRSSSSEAGEAVSTVPAPAASPAAPKAGGSSSSSGSSSSESGAPSPKSAPKAAPETTAAPKAASSSGSSSSESGAPSPKAAPKAAPETTAAPKASSSSSSGSSSSESEAPSPAPTAAPKAASSSSSASGSSSSAAEGAHKAPAPEKNLARAGPRQEGRHSMVKKRDPFSHSDSDESIVSVSATPVSATPESLVSGGSRRTPESGASGGSRRTPESSVVSGGSRRTPESGASSRRTPESGRPSSRRSSSVDLSKHYVSEATKRKMERKARGGATDSTAGSGDGGREAGPIAGGSPTAARLAGPQVDIGEDGKIFVLGRVDLDGPDFVHDARRAPWLYGRTRVGNVDIGGDFYGKGGAPPTTRAAQEPPGPGDRPSKPVDPEVSYVLGGDRRHENIIRTKWDVVRYPWTKRDLRGNPPTECSPQRDLRGGSTPWADLHARELQTGEAVLGRIERLPDRKSFGGGATSRVFPASSELPRNGVRFSGGEVLSGKTPPTQQHDTVIYNLFIMFML